MPLAAKPKGKKTSDFKTPARMERSFGGKKKKKKLLTNNCDFSFIKTLSVCVCEITEENIHILTLTAFLTNDSGVQMWSLFRYSC